MRVVDLFVIVRVVRVVMCKGVGTGALSLGACVVRGVVSLVLGVGLVLLLCGLSSTPLGLAMGKGVQIVQLAFHGVEETCGPAPGSARRVPRR